MSIANHLIRRLLPMLGWSCCGALIAASLYAQESTTVVAAKDPWATSFWSARTGKLAVRGGTYAASDKTSLAIGALPDMSIIDGANGVLVHDIAEVGSERCLLVQTDVNQLELWSGTQRIRRERLNRLDHGVFLIDAVVDQAWNRIISIGCDHVDPNSDEMNGAGSLLTTRFNGMEIGERFRFPDRPIDVSRDAFCRSVAVTTFRGGLFFFRNRTEGVECMWIENPSLGTYPNVAVNVDGAYVMAYGSFGIKCFASESRKVVYSHPLADEWPRACFIGTSKLCWCVGNMLTVVELKDGVTTVVTNDRLSVAIDICSAGDGRGVICLAGGGLEKSIVDRVTYIDTEKGE